MWEESDKRLVGPCCETVTPFPRGALQQQLKKPLSRLADGMEEGGDDFWPEVTGGWFVESWLDAGVQVFVDRMTLVHRRRWIDVRELNPHPFLTVMPVVGRVV